MPHTHRPLLPLLLAFGLSHCAPPPDEEPPLPEPPQDAQVTEHEAGVLNTSHCRPAYLVEDIRKGPEGSLPQDCGHG